MLTKYEQARHAVRAEVLETIEVLADTNKEGYEALVAGDTVRIEAVRKNLKCVTSCTEKIDNDIVLIFARYTPEARDLREMVSYLKITSALNRIRTNILHVWAESFKCMLFRPYTYRADFQPKTGYTFVKTELPDA